MLSLIQVQKIIELSKLSNKEISEKMGKSEKYLSAQIATYRTKNLPFTTHLCKLLFKVIKPSIYKKVVGPELLKLCCSDYFLSADQFYKFIKASSFKQKDLTDLMGLGPKTIYMEIRANGGVKFHLVKKLFEICPKEISHVLTDIQLEVILDHL